MEITHDPLTERQQKLVDEGRDVSLHALTNVAPGTWGYDVLALVRKGLWECKRRHVADDACGDFAVYGPRG